ncbi:hypothetical protein Gpo141_00005451 [Globisporangium polare]
MVSAGSHHGEEELGGALALALRHRALQQQERRRGREDVRTQLLLPVAVVSREDDVKRRRGDDCRSRELEFLQQVTERRGFVTQQLQSQATLRPLERWFHQLQLILLTASHSDGARDDSPASEEEEDHAMALLKLERVLAQDVACFDLQYASGTRVQDVVTRPFGSGSHSQPSLPEEILSFSSMKRGSVCRVTCVHTNAQHQQPQYAFHSSLFIRDFAAKATQLLIQSRDAHSLVELVRSEPPPRA